MLRTILRVVAMILLAGTLLTWTLLGANRGWTKTSILVEKTDDVTGLNYSEVVNRFVPGVDLLALGVAGSAFLAVISLIPKKSRS